MDKLDIIKNTYSLKDSIKGIKRQPHSRRYLHYGKDLELKKKKLLPISKEKTANLIKNWQMV